LSCAEEENHTRPATAKVVARSFSRAPHRLGGRVVEVAAALPVHVLVAREPDVRLVDEGGGLQGVVLALARHALRRDLAQLVVHERQQALRVRTRAQDGGDFVGALHGAAAPGRAPGRGSRDRSGCHAAAS